jgi:ATP-dependent Clp protease protease subunit
MSNNLNYDDISAFFQLGVLCPSRTIYLGSTEYDGGEEAGVNFRLAERVIKAVITLNALNQEEPISLIINNFGGDEYHGLAIYEALRTSVSPIHAVVMGTAMSMASIILQAAEKRSITKNSMLMMHYGSWAMNVDAKDVKPWAKENDRYNSWMEHIYLNRMRKTDKKMTLKKVQEILKTDCLLTATQAKALGLVDEII